MIGVHSSCWALVIAALSFAGFAGLTQLHPAKAPGGEQSSPDRVVISAPVLLALNGGDRFLAANLETMRLSATGVEWGVADASYLVRAQRVVSELNACQEHNYYLANALLNWGGALDEGSQILARATTCRFWDELPPFFYGFNRAFFYRDPEGAGRYLEVAAQRATNNAAGFRKMAIMLRAEQFHDEHLALDFLRNEYDQARDPKLKMMLGKRVVRLEGLLILREAQRSYEVKTGAVLQNADQLIASGVLQSLPVDPLNLGYEIIDGRFMLKKLKVAGAEERK